jgi:hypothetical protein
MGNVLWGSFEQTQQITPGSQIPWSLIFTSGGTWEWSFWVGGKPNSLNYFSSKGRTSEMSQLFTTLWSHQKVQRVISSNSYKVFYHFFRIIRYEIPCIWRSIQDPMWLAAKISTVLPWWSYHILLSSYCKQDVSISIEPTMYMIFTKVFFTNATKCAWKCHFSTALKT